MRKITQQYENIPASLENAIAGMGIHDRGLTMDNDGNWHHRVMLMLASETTCAWHHDEEATSKRILEGWPGLSEGQLNQAMRSIRGRIRAVVDEPPVTSHTSDYMTNYGPRGWFGLGSDHE